MGTWSGDDQGSIRTVLIDHDGDSAASDAEGPLAEQKPTTVLDILQERSCIGQVANTWNCPKPTAVAPESPSGCTTPLDAIDPEFEREFDAIISAVSPSAESKTYRGEVYAYVARLLKSQDVCIEVCAFGSVPLETYLPDGDIDICAFFTCETSVGLSEVHHMLQREVANPDAAFQIDRDPQLVFAGVPVIKCVVGSIPVDISANQVRGLSAVCFLNTIDHVVGCKNLFKKSILAVKVWCSYESRILGSHGGLLPSYAVEVLVLNVLNRYEHCTTPAAVLAKFLQCYARFRWEDCVMALLPEEAARAGCAANPATDESVSAPLRFVDEAQMAELYDFYRSDLDGTQDYFIPKFMNILDPLDSANNLGRSVNQASFHRILHALKLGAQQMSHLSAVQHGLGGESGAARANSFLRSTQRMRNRQFRTRPDVRPPGPAAPWRDNTHQLHFHLQGQHQKLVELKARFVAGGVETIMPSVPMGRVIGRALSEWRLSISEIPSSATSTASTPETSSAPSRASELPAVSSAGIGPPELGWEETPTKAHHSPMSASASLLDQLNGSDDGPQRGSHSRGGHHTHRGREHGKGRQGGGNSKCPWSSSQAPHSAPPQRANGPDPSAVVAEPVQSFSDVQAWPDLTPAESGTPSPHKTPPHNAVPMSKADEPEPESAPVIEAPVEPLVVPPVKPEPVSVAKRSSWANLASGKQQPVAIAAAAGNANAWAAPRSLAAMLQQTTRGAPQPNNSRMEQQPVKQQAGQPRRTATKGKPTERTPQRRMNESRTAAWGGQSSESKKEDARPGGGGGMRRASKPKQSPDAARNTKGKPSNNNKKEDAVADAWTVVSTKPVRPAKKGGSGGGSRSR